MKCIKCGAENLEDSTFCGKCGNELKKEENLNLEKTQNMKKTEKSNEERVYIIVAVISMIFGLFVRLIPGAFIASIAIITGKLKCPDSKVLKILFWLVILMYVAYVIFVIGMMIACNQAVQTFPR